MNKENKKHPRPKRKKPEGQKVFVTFKRMSTQQSTKDNVRFSPLRLRRCTFLRIQLSVLAEFLSVDRPVNTGAERGGGSGRQCAGVRREQLGGASDLNFKSLS